MVVEDVWVSMLFFEKKEAKMKSQDYMNISCKLQKCLMLIQSSLKTGH